MWNIPEVAGYTCLNMADQTYPSSVVVFIEPSILMGLDDEEEGLRKQGK